MGRILGLKPEQAAQFLREMAAQPEPVRRQYAVELGLLGGKGAANSIAANREPVPRGGVASAAPRTSSARGRR